MHCVKLVIKIVISDAASAGLPVIWLETVPLGTVIWLETVPLGTTDQSSQAALNAIAQEEALLSLFYKQERVQEKLIEPQARLAQQEAKAAAAVMTSDASPLAQMAVHGALSTSMAPLIIGGAKRKATSMWALIMVFPSGGTRIASPRRSTSTARRDRKQNTLTVCRLIYILWV